MGMEGRTAVRPSGITPDFHAAFKQTWYNNLTWLEWTQTDRPRVLKFSVSIESVK